MRILKRALFALMLSVASTLPTHANAQDGDQNNARAVAYHALVGTVKTTVKDCQSAANSVVHILTQRDGRTRAQAMIDIAIGYCENAAQRLSEIAPSPVFEEALSTKLREGLSLLAIAYFEQALYLEDLRTTDISPHKEASERAAGQGLAILTGIGLREGFYSAKR